MRWNAIVPAITSSTVSMNTRKRLRTANWTMRWIIYESAECELRTNGQSSSLLQCVCELQKQRSLRDYLVSGLQALCHLRQAGSALSNFYRALRELILALAYIDKRLVFAIAQHCRIGNRDGIGDHSRLHDRVHIHVFLQLLAGILRDDAGLQRVRIRIERRSEIGDLAREFLLIRVGFDRDRIADVNVSQVALIHVHDHPH